LIENPQAAPNLADVNWQRLAAVRQALLHAARSSPGLDRRRLRGVSIRHRPGDSALAWLLAGWLEASFAGSIDSAVLVEEAAREPDVLIVSVGSLTVTLTAHAAVADPGPDAAPFVVAVAGRNEAEGVAAELRSLEPDVSLRDSLETLTRRLVTSR
jgi:glucose-6-phosphate dehydrogenase assembly protein OpcA